MKKIIILLILTGIFSSCKRDTDKSLFGPEVAIVPEDFKVSGFTIYPSDYLNLATEDMYVECALHQRAEFQILIKGMTSGAEKKISGVANSMDASNNIWTGDSDNLAIFRSGEECLVELSFRGAVKKYYDTIALEAANKYSNTFLINNFEGITFDKNGPNGATYGNYFDGPDFAKSDIKTDNVLKALEGVQSVTFDGLDVNNSYYMGGLYFYPASLGTYNFGTDRADSLYLNAYVYSYGDNSTKLNFTFSEDDNNDNAINLTKDDDRWGKEVAVEGQGWSLVSIRIKDFTDLNTTVGNGVFNVDRIREFNVNANSVTAGGKIHVSIDNIIVSYGRPFEP